MVPVHAPDAEGRAVYLLEADTAGVSTCLDACAQAWPPVPATGGGPSAAAPPIRTELIGTARRPDGSEQVTYGGHPLYYYAEDQGPGTAAGQDVHDRWGEWYLVRPSGEKLEERQGGGRAEPYRRLGVERGDALEPGALPYLPAPEPGGSTGEARERDGGG